MCTGEIIHKLREEDGVHDMWVGETVYFQNGAIIAIGSDFRPTSSIQSLLKIENDESLKPGQMQINPTTDDGFYFNVKVASDLFKFLRSPGGSEHNKHSRSILIHAVQFLSLHTC